MPDGNQCSCCGKPLDAILPGGMCSACTIALGLDGATDAESALETPPEATIQLNEAGHAAECGRRIGRYKVLQQIGEGGCGVVYLAEQEEPVRRRVALKIIKLGMDTREVIVRFEAERQALAMLDHPNIAKVLDAGATERGRPYFVMELVRGTRITRFCDQQQCNTRRRLELFRDVCSAINHAHQKGIIHRDLKPSNILVSLHGDKPVVKVIDFGIAKATQSKLTDKTLFTRFEQFLGTPVYMSPEQAAQSGLDIDTRSDIYALGVLLYELLAGRPPFDPKTLVSAGYEEMRRIIREEEPPRPSLLLSAVAKEETRRITVAHGAEPQKLSRLVKGDLDWIVMKAIEKDRTRRYETANAFSQDIRRYLDDEPVTAAAPRVSCRLRKFVRRNKLALGMAAGIAGVLVVATGVSAWQALRATEAEALATKRLTESEQAREDAEVISTFLMELFQSPNPTRQGRTITVAETLDAAATKLETDLAGQPDRRAKLQRALGGTYQALGLYQEAFSLQSKARDYYLATHGPEHPETLRAGREMAASAHNLGRRNEALEMLEEVLESSQKVVGPAHPDTLKAMASLALSYHESGRLDEALQMREQTLELTRKTLGAEHILTFYAINSLATSYRSVSRAEEALQMWEELLEVSRKVFGVEHVRTLLAMSNLAVAYSEMGHREKALEIQEQVLEVRLKVLGPKHPDTLMAMNNLANSYHESDRQDEALQIREYVLEQRREALGPEHPDTLAAINNLTVSYSIDEGRRHEAIEMGKELLELRRKAVGPEHPDTLNAMNNLAVSYYRAARREEALHMLEEVLALRRKVLGPEAADTLSAMNNVALLYHEQGRLTEALKMREDLLALRRKVLGKAHPDTIEIIRLLVAEYSRAGQWEKALPLMAEQSASEPADTILAMKLAALQVWFGRDADYAATASRMLAWVKDTDASDSFERVAKIASLRAIDDAATREAALALARQSNELAEERGNRPWFLMGLGMAEFRNENYGAAEQRLAEAVRTVTTHTLGIDARANIHGTTRYYRAMSLFHLGKKDEARKLFAATEENMRPCPPDALNPWPVGADHDHLILWLAYKEARELLTAPKK